MPTARFPHEQTSVTGVLDMHLYTDHRIILKCTFLVPTPPAHTCTYQIHTQTHLNVTHTHAQTHAERTLPAFLGTALLGKYRCTQAYVHTCAHTDIWSMEHQPMFRFTPLVRNPGYTAKKRLAPLQVTLVKPPVDALNGPPPLHPYSQRPPPTPHQAAPDSSRIGFEVCTTTQGADPGA